MIEEITYFYDLHLSIKNVFLYKIRTYFQKLLEDTKIMSFNVEEVAPLVLQKHNDIFNAVRLHDDKLARKLMLDYQDAIKSIHNGNKRS